MDEKTGEASPNAPNAAATKRSQAGTGAPGRRGGEGGASCVSVGGRPCTQSQHSAHGKAVPMRVVESWGRDVWAVRWASEH